MVSEETDSNMGTGTVRPRAASYWVRGFWHVRNALAALGLVFLVYHLCFEVSVVVSSSMAPTLVGDGGATSDWVLSERLTLWFRPPRRWEVVRFRNVEGYAVAKRVVALPGERIALRDQRAIIDGDALDLPTTLGFLEYYAWGRLDDGKTMSCGEGYFVLGDDSRDSADSRFDGPVDPEAIESRAWLRVWPLSRIGFVNP